MAGAGPLSSHEVARRSGCGERYVREWLNSQVAGGYVDYHPASATYELTPEQAAVLADDTSPVFLPHAWQVVASMWADEAKALDAFKTGRGRELGRAQRAAVLRRRRLLPQLLQREPRQGVAAGADGVTAKLERGAKVADVGCGHGHSTVLMAKAFPESRFWGFDVHEGSIEIARRVAREAGVADRVSFEVAKADDYARHGYDLICFFDCLHDMGRPVDAVRYAKTAMAEDGTIMLVEPFAGDRVEDNINPVGRLYYAARQRCAAPTRSRRMERTSSVPRQARAGSKPC